MSFSHMIESFEFCTIWKHVYSFAMHLRFNPISLIDLSINPNILPKTLYLIINKSTFIFISIFKNYFSLTLFYSILKLSLVSILSDQYFLSISIEFIFIPPTLLYHILSILNTLPLNHSIFPLTLKDISLLIDHSPKSMRISLKPISLITRSVFRDKYSVAISLLILHLSIVYIFYTILLN